MVRSGSSPFQPYGSYPPYIYDSLEALFLKNKPETIGEKESSVICALMRDFLIYDPAKRPSAVKLLQHPWFSAGSELRDAPGCCKSNREAGVCTDTLNRVSQKLDQVLVALL